MATNHSAIIEKVRKSASALEMAADEDIRNQSLALKHIAMCGCSISKLIDLAFPLVVEAARRTLGISYYDVQLRCGIEMAHGHLAEMKTGEGKTLTASLAAYIYALYGKGLHLVTFNDYLAERDCGQNRPIFELLGLRVASLADGMTPDQRQRAYGCDITYGAAKEFGFDFLRDRLTRAFDADAAKSYLTRGTHYALIDEADSILIDEARTPLIIGMRDGGETLISHACYQWAAEHAKQFEERLHYDFDATRQTFSLNAGGIRLTRALPQNEGTRRVPIRQLYNYIENAIQVRQRFHRDKNYAVRGEEIVIIDEFTGRPSEGREWQAGIHQSIQAKEGVEISAETRQTASVTIQSYFKQYKVFCGMTGTAWTSRREIAKVYRKRVVRIPTRLPIDRTELPVRVFANENAKFDAVAKSAQRATESGQAVLIGSRSIETSVALGQHLANHGLTFEILNANHLENEGEIIAQAAQKPAITVATNMAGRGTDIKLASDVRDAGGLHVILTEIHESQRIDWQLIGRGSRQGDPGSYQIFVALSDEILRVGLGPERAKRFQHRFENADESELKRLFSVFRRAQRKIERRHLTDRMAILKNDEQRKRSAFQMGLDPYLSVVTG